MKVGALFARPSAGTKLSVCTIYLCGPKPTPKTGLTHLYELLFTKTFPSYLLIFGLLNK